MLFDLECTYLRFNIWILQSLLHHSVTHFKRYSFELIRDTRNPQTLPVKMSINGNLPIFVAGSTQNLSMYIAFKGLQMFIRNSQYF